MPGNRKVMKEKVPTTFWMTGLPGSGKSTLATAMRFALLERGLNCCILDGDVMRQGLTRDLGFSATDRRENIRRVAEVARLLNDAGVFVVSALVSPARDDRSMAREIVGEKTFHEIYIATPLSVCEMRDPKGLYKRARAGEIADMTGIGSPYEIPTAPALAINTVDVPVVDAVNRMLDLIRALS